METETKETVIFTLRISSGLNERIIAEAKKQKRSRQAQIEIALEGIFENGDKKGSKK